MRQALHEFWNFFAVWLRAFTNIGLATEQYTEWGKNEATCFNEAGKVEQEAKLRDIRKELAVPE